MSTDWTTDPFLLEAIDRDNATLAANAAVEAYKRTFRTRIEEAVSKVAYRIEREAWDTDASLAVNAVRAAVLAVLENDQCA